MPESKQCVCALCDSMAQFEHHDGSQFRYYECPNCKNSYAISERAIRYLKEYPKRKLPLTRKVAEMPNEGEILEITYDLAKDDLKVTKVPRTKYS